jgi:hypothetical protein
MVSFQSSPRHSQRSGRRVSRPRRRGQQDQSAALNDAARTVLYCNPPPACGHGQSTSRTSEDERPSQVHLLSPLSQRTVAGVSSARGRASLLIMTAHGSGFVRHAWPFEVKACGRPGVRAEDDARRWAAAKHRDRTPPHALRFREAHPFQAGREAVGVPQARSSPRPHAAPSVVNESSDALGPVSSVSSRKSRQGTGRASGVASASASPQPSASRAVPAPTTGRRGRDLRSHRDSKRVRSQAMCHSTQTAGQIGDPLMEAEMAGP